MDLALSGSESNTINVMARHEWGRKNKFLLSFLKNNTTMDMSEMHAYFLVRHEWHKLCYINRQDSKILQFCV